ncbi:MAG: B12-binding domain-containing radical SAM protein, partial [Planctomycetota bacterium]
STADYPNLEELVSRLHTYFQDKYVGLSLPSLRVDRQLKLLPLLVTSVRKSGLTIAVEAASERLRQIINKPLKDEDLFAGVEAAYRAGWQKLKLYFMVGLPGETEQDIKQIVKLCYDLARVRKKLDSKTGQINITVSWLVPKPHTPFGWLAQKPTGYFEHAKRLILDEKRNLRAKFLQFKFHRIDRSILESAIGRGDRRLCDVIEQAWRDGAKFDLWDECFNYEIWQNAFEKFSMNIDSLARRQFSPDEILPWEHLGGPGKDYLLGHLDAAKSVSREA